MKITVTFLFLTISALTFSQEEPKEQSIISDDIGKNVIYVSAGSVVFYNSVSLNYDLRIGHLDKGFFKNYYLNLRTGFFSTAAWSGLSTAGGLGHLGFIGLTGKKKNHFETGLGFSVNIITEVTGNGDNEIIRDFVLPDLALGYRYQEKNGTMFRAGIGYPRLAYLGLGYSF